MMTEEQITSRAREVEAFFHRKADLIDELAQAGRRDEVTILATTALDALGAVWFSDFPEVESSMKQECGGKPPLSLRMARLMATFVPGDPEAAKVAVVCFAEDLLRYKPELTWLAGKLLDPRCPERDEKGLHFGELPRSYLDKTRAELLEECPELTDSPGLPALIEEYTYPAVLYRFFRCPLVHMASGSNRTHGFASGKEVMYMRFNPSEITAISFGPQLLTGWVRSVASGYVAACVEAGRGPAGNVDAGKDAEGWLEGRWKRLAG